MTTAAGKRVVGKVLQAYFLFSPGSKTMVGKVTSLLILWRDVRSALCKFLKAQKFKFVLGCANMQNFTGLTASILAGVPPIIGLYMAFFPVFTYMFMSTSRHINLGILQQTICFNNYILFCVQEHLQLSAS
jgi:Sulfate permease family